MNKQKQAFTLVELIVVITILAILGTIAFISLEGYSKTSRDSVRISDMGKIKTSLELLQIQAGKYPLPTEIAEITYSGATVWSQGYFGETTFQNVERLDKIPKDPLIEKEYIYSTTNTRQEYQLSGIMEGDEITFNSNIVNAGDETALLRISGNYNGQFVKISTGSVDYILAVPSLISSTGVTDLEIIISNNLLGYNGYKNLPFQYEGGRYNIIGDSGINLVNNSDLVVFSGDLKDLGKTDNTGITARHNFVTKLQNAYSGTTIQNEGQIKILLTADTNNIDSLGTTLINNNLGGKLTVSTDNFCIDEQTPTDESYFTFNSSTQTITDYNTAGGTDIVIPCKIGGVGVTSIGTRAFNNNSLTSVTIPASVTSIGTRAFNNNSLTSVTIPASVTNIGDYAFVNNALTSVINYDGLTSTGYIYLPSGNGIEINDYIGTDTVITIPNSFNLVNVISIGTNAFNNNSLTSVTIPASVISIGTNAFNNNSLTSVTIPASVTSIGTRAFSNNSLTSVTIPASVTNIGDYAFVNNALTSVINYDGLTSTGYIYLPSGNGIEINDYIGTDTVITIPNSFNLVNVISIGTNAFNNNSLTSVTIPASVTNIGDYAFVNNALTSVTIPASVTNIGDYAFVNNALTSVINYDGLTSTGYIYLPSGNGIEINDYIGTDTVITIPNSFNGVNVINIGIGAFSNKSLTSVIIPASVTSIGTNAFPNNSLTSVTIPASVTSIGDYAFTGQNNSVGGGTVYGSFSIQSNYYNSTYFDIVKLPNYVVQ